MLGGIDIRAHIPDTEVPVLHDRGPSDSSYSTAREAYLCRIEVLETARVVICVHPQGLSSAGTLKYMKEASELD